MRTNVELLAPAGSFEALQAAVQNGCDAVYLGGTMFGARAFAHNFDDTQMETAVKYAHVYGVRVYVTVNTLLYEKEMEEVIAYVKRLQDMDVDALIIQDIGLFTLLHERFPDMELHASTQMHIHNPQGIAMLQEMGAARVVVPRETTIEEIREYAKLGVDLEVFVQGALCVSYSGQCLMSSLTLARSGNRGECAQSCRMQYTLEEDHHGLHKEITTKGQYLLSPKDLNTLEQVPTLIEAGIASFKIEGRMKTALYVATVARTYRKAIDDYMESPELYKEHMPWYLEQISNCTYRQFTTGFFFGKPSEEAQIYDNNTYLKEYTYLGIVGDCIDGLYQIEQRNKFSVGEEIEVMKPSGENLIVTVQKILDEDGNEMESAPHPKQKLLIDLGTPLVRYDILRRKEEEC